MTLVADLYDSETRNSILNTDEARLIASRQARILLNSLDKARSFSSK